MIFFAFYAGLVWYGALKRRREVMGFVWTLLGFLGVAIVGVLHYMLNVWTNGAICLPVLQSLLYPFGGLILVMGVYLACLPPRYTGTRCRTCGYDLRGLETDDRVCPECATRHVLFHGRGEPCRQCSTPLRAREREHAHCGVCGTYHLLIGRSRVDCPEVDRHEQIRVFDEAVPEAPRVSARERIRRVLASRPAEGQPQQQHQHRDTADHQGADELELRV